MAIEHGLTIIGWHENHIGEDLPPHYLWDDDEGLKQHWDMVRERNEEKYGTKKGKGEALEQVPMESNDLARELRG